MCLTTRERLVCLTTRERDWCVSPGVSKRKFWDFSERGCWGCRGEVPMSKEEYMYPAMQKDAAKQRDAAAAADTAKEEEEEKTDSKKDA